MTPPELDYHKQDVFFATNREFDEKAAGEERYWAAFTTEAEDFLQYGKATVAIPKVRAA